MIIHLVRMGLSILVGLAVTATAYADMTPTFAPDAGCPQSQHVRVPINPGHTNCLTQSSYPVVADFAQLSIEFLPQARADTAPASETQPLLILTDGAGSFSLCLYALIGLGLCKSAPFVKKLSFGCIPEWYHDGGPFQIGHSHAIGPESLCSAQVCCFVQPDCTAEDISPEYYKGTIASLLRKSLFTPNVLASRGPPETD
jgi:hypothetical protein